MSARIGILGGAFNPPHYGHLRPAREALAALALDRLLWLPTGDHPFKGPELLAPVAHRVAMTRLIIADEPRFALSAIEAERSGTTYTHDTLSRLRRAHPHEQLLFLMGADLFQELHLWKRWRELIRLAHLVVMVRPGYEALLEESEAARFLSSCRVPSASALTTPAGGWLTLAVTPQAISSTAIRHRLSAGQPVTGLLPPAVEGYIRRQRLYGATP